MTDIHPELTLEQVKQGLVQRNLVNHGGGGGSGQSASGLRQHHHQLYHHHHMQVGKEVAH